MNQPARRPVKRPRRAPPRLYVGEWIRRLGLKQVEVARSAQIGESYLSLIISHKKYPSVAVLADIAAAMGVPEQALRQPPPDEATVRALSGLDPALLSRLQPKFPS